MKKIIFILLDGCNYLVAKQCMPYMTALTSKQKASYTKHQCSCPPLSRPLYFSILSGLLPLESGITHNTVWNKCQAPTIFSLAQKNNLITAAAAYHWISELCNTNPFIPEMHRITNNPDLPIAHGIFYFNENYPDNHVFADAEALRTSNDPDFLLVHCMGIDDAGHTFGANSEEYIKAIYNIDQLLAQYLPLWLDNGYSIVITSDHGMDANGNHYSDTDMVRNIPVWTLGDDFAPPKEQVHWFKFCCKHLNIVT